MPKINARVRMARFEPLRLSDLPDGVWRSRILVRYTRLRQAREGERHECGLVHEFYE